MSGIVDSVADFLDPPPTHLCRLCGNSVRPLSRSKLNGFLLIGLLFLFIVPGVLYFLWGATQHVAVCPECRALNSMIPLGSPEAKRLSRA